MTQGSLPRFAGRSEPELLAQHDARLPGYVPGFVAVPGSAARALEQVTAGFGAAVARSLERSLPRAQLAFLDTCGESRQPAQAASSVLVFTLATPAPGDAPLPRGTGVAALVAQNPADPPPVFTTQQSIALVGARLAAVYSVDPREDRWDDCSADPTSGFTLFANASAIEHAIYLGHDSLFNLPARARLALSFELLGLAAAPVRDLPMVWEYRGPDAWWPLDGSVADRLISDGRVDLVKSGGPPASKLTLLGRESYWVRGWVSGATVSSGDRNRLPKVLNAQASLEFRGRELRADAAFVDSASLDVSAPCMPFGRNPTAGTTFYLGCTEAFGRPGARVIIQVTVLDAEHTSRAKGRMSWEFFNGETWAELPNVIDTTRVLFDTSAASSDAAAQPQSGYVTFFAPPQWQSSTIGRKTSHFLRVRLGSTTVFGAPPDFDGDGTFIPGKQQPPQLGVLSISFELRSPPSAIRHCISANAALLRDHSALLGASPAGFEPFVAVDDDQPAVYLGFDRQLPVGLVSLYLEVEANPEVEGAAGSAFVWEYWSTRGVWLPLGVRDETNGFRQSGFIQWIGALDAAASDGHGGALYRVRARLKQGARLVTQPVLGLWLNAVSALHAEVYGGEPLGTTDGTPRQSLSFPAARTPIHEGETVELREWNGRDRGYEAILDDVPSGDGRLVRDPVSGEVVELWVRWRAVAHLLAADASARVYSIERASGILRFGDGEHGAIPRPGAAVRVALTTGGGILGNVRAGVVGELRAALPLVVTVTNPRPAAGGSDVEPLELTRLRGAERLRHRGRALSPRDFEWLAVEASPAVARARCLALTGPAGGGQLGWVTLVIVPQGGEPQPAPSATLCERVRQYVAQRAAATLAGRIRVIGPRYRPVSVTTEIVPDGTQAPSALEAELRGRLDEFLHPLRGGRDGRGWQVGQGVPASQVALLLESTPGVDFARSLTLHIRGDVQGDEALGREEMLVAPGEHELRLTLSTEAC